MKYTCRAHARSAYSGTRNEHTHRRKRVDLEGEMRVSSRDRRKRGVRKKKTANEDNRQIKRMINREGRGKEWTSLAETVRRERTAATGREISALHLSPLARKLTDLLGGRKIVHGGGMNSGRESALNGGGATSGGTEGWRKRPSYPEPRRRLTAEHQ